MNRTGAPEIPFSGSASPPDAQPLLGVRELCVTVDEAPILDNISFKLQPGETLGIVGESGCGKSTLALAIMGLLPTELRISAGSITFRGTELVGLPPTAYRKIRGKRLAFIAQNPGTAFNPLQTIGSWMLDAMRVHFNSPREHLRRRALDVLKTVEFEDPMRVWNSYPHQLSGGMLQRVLIATSLCLEPDVLIADEPTTALDATIRRQIVQLLQKIQQKSHLAFIIISHDFGIIRALCNHTLVIYAGQAVEYGNTQDVLRYPAHPYTLGLKNAIPHLTDSQEWLADIPGDPPSPATPFSGCRFAPRCPDVKPRCQEPPPLRQEKNRQIRCWFPNEWEGK